MVFTPDYPGDYLIEVIISQYGDEISNQTFSFSILDAIEKQSAMNKSEEENDGNNDSSSSSLGVWKMHWINRCISIHAHICWDDEQYISMHINKSNYYILIR